MSEFPSLVVFGSLGSWPSAEELLELRISLKQHDNLEPVRRAISELPDLWKSIEARDPSLNAISGLAAAERLASWASSEGNTSFDSTQSNILGFPLTIISHVCNYLTYLQQNGISHPSLLDYNRRAAGMQGFCAGLLSALAVASSDDERKIGIHGAFSVYLAFIIGAYVESDALMHGQTSCVAVRWRSPDSISSVENILEKHDGAYVSVVRGTNEATITVPSSQSPEVCKSLSDNGISALDTGLTGRYHTQGHQGIPEKILEHCKEYGDIIFGEGSSARSDKDGKILSHSDAAISAVRDILVEVSDWTSSLAKSASRLVKTNGEPFVLAIGADVVRSVLPKSTRVIMASGLRNAKPPPLVEGPSGKYPEHAIAIVGMSCKFPGADSPEEFWQLLTEGTAMVDKVSTDQWPGSLSSRGNSAKQEFWGNFISEPDVFDHRFFKKSSREAASMDPQQRLLLQAAYEAMESTGYFAASSKLPTRDIGCYLGLCAVDYDANVASHNPNAFSTLGTLRAFLSGKLSHFFGWSGPSLTFDTACSSSAVAIHTACRALQANECTQALAGGVALFTSPYLYENLSAAHFLSPTGATKPFDAKADGYCRGEGLGLVVLKPFSTAMADGDNILAVIGGSAINQNDSCVPITVPNAPSQEALYRNAAQQAGIIPQNISFVEAHGTGTPVGDPIEMESIRHSFAGPGRDTQLIVSSVKGNIGHLEGASGVAGLIKAILQIENRTAVLQASFQSLNPRIPPLGPDKIVVPASNIPLRDNFITACVNNYGAAGSNCTLMVLQPPTKAARNMSPLSLSQYPIIIAANSESSVLEYCKTLRQYLQRNSGPKAPISSISFSLNLRHNHKLPYIFTAAVSDTSNLEAELTRQITDVSKSSIQQRPSRRSTILMFGGQVRAFVGLSRECWEQFSVLRFHLDRCDDVLRSFGYPSIYPAIFQREPISDIVVLHSAVFALQYASAESWISSGLVVDTVIGHSLGQLTALSVSGILSLEDGLKFVAGRATLMKQYWGSESGSMILVEADLQQLSNIKHSLEIACYNAPSSQVMVGKKASVDEFEHSLQANGTKFKRLEVTNGFHSEFTDPLILPLKELASTLQFNKPSIPIETCSDGSSWLESTADLLAKHTRDPVFFGQAVQRLSSTYGNSVWLEAGSDSGIVSMARRVLDGPRASQHSFIASRLSGASAIGSVVDLTLQLWVEGVPTQFWAFNSFQKDEYDKIRLPPYQWEKNKHWLELCAPQSPEPMKTVALPASEPEVPQLIKLARDDPAEKTFTINPRSDEYQGFVSGHVVAGGPLCPATVYMEIAARACKMIAQWNSAPLLEFCNLRIDSPLGLAADRNISLTLRAQPSDSWEYTITSQPRETEKVGHVSHATGIIQLQRDVEAVGQEFSRYQRLTGPELVDNLYHDPESESIRGPMVYKLFSRVVNYSGPYQGLKSVAARNSRIAGTVVALPEFATDTVLTSPPTVDSWMQIGGIHANSFYPCPDDEVYVFTQVDRVQFGPKYTAPSAESSLSWKIFSNLTSNGPKEVSNDIFVFDSVSGELVVLILGARFHNVRLVSLKKVLSRVNNDGATIAPPNQNAVPREETVIQPSTDSPAVVPEPQVPASHPVASEGSTSIFNDVCVVFERVAEVPRHNVKGTMTVDDLGIDSLMMMEVVSEVSSHFSIDLPIADMEILTDVDSLVNYLLKKGCAPGEISAPSSENLSSTNSSRSSIKAPGTPPSEALTPAGNRHYSKQMEQLAKLLQGHLELDSTPGSNDNLADMGLDSLLAIELGDDIEKMFSVSIDLHQIDETSTFGDLARLFGLEVTVPSDIYKLSGLDEPASQASPPSVYPAKVEAGRGQFGHAAPSTSDSSSHITGVPDVSDAFEQVRLSFDKLSQQEGFANFWRVVYPSQERLVLAYTANAFKKLGCDLGSIPSRSQLASISVLKRHIHLLERMYKILSDGGYISGQQSTGYTRTSKPFDLDDPQVLLQKIISSFPLHASEHRLLNVTGSRLSECLTGKADPLALLFANRANRKLLADVYDLAPMCRATTRLLACFMGQAFPPNNEGKVFHFLEVGGGTGGTTKFLVDYLSRRGVPFTYTFTDISSALTGAMKKEMADYGCMRYATLDVEKNTNTGLLGQFDAIISTNCVHATRNATSSLANLRSMLRPDGVLALVEFTNGLYWFDLVYGLLDGWWLFDDGRHHALGDITFWDRSLRAAGYKQTGWTDGDTPESRTLRLICGFNSVSARSSETRQLSKRAGVAFETVAWKEVDGVQLNADIYYPSVEEQRVNKARPVALLLHGGGHVLFTRKDIHIKHIKNILERGFLPISFDYRLCPEVKLSDGPMTDACDALEWTKSTLPSLHLARPDVKIGASRVAAVGWSSGGHLAMTLAYTAPARGLQAPDSILAFYCPSNFEADWWNSPIYPKAVKELPETTYDLLEGIRESPIVGYKPSTAIGAPMSLQDPRWRIVIHYNWKAQLVPVLVRGLPTKTQSTTDPNLSQTDNWEALPMPSTGEIQAASPYAQVVRGRYRTPTFIVHGDQDDLIPWQQSQETIAALNAQGVENGIAVPRDAGHAFDLWTEEDPRGTGWAAVEEGYDFICRLTL